MRKFFEDHMHYIRGFRKRVVFLVKMRKTIRPHIRPIHLFVVIFLVTLVLAWE